jgi:hypothetical protein
MPQISRFHGIVVRMFFDDHWPPHFHAAYAEHRISIAIESGKVLSGNLPPRQLRLVQTWAGLHRTELQDNWSRAMTGKDPAPIAPLP